MLFDIFVLVCGFLLLFFGAEGLVKGSIAIAQRLKISELVVGLTIVAFGTSSPELVVSAKASWMSADDLALGNIIGSNICNIGLILGLSALIRPVQVSLQVIRLQVPILIFVSVIITYFLHNRYLSRTEGVVLLLGMLVYAVFTVKSDSKNVTESGIESRLKNIWIELFLICAGIVLLYLGANWVIESSLRLSVKLGISQAVIGLLLVAFGTSLPELATSVMASIRKNNDIALGNVVGSNIFNMLGVLGVSSVLSPIHVFSVRALDIGFMIGLAVLMLPIFYSGLKITRWEGGIILFVYLLYLFSRFFGWP
ncbi:calcium/sodium antiporter [candidate division KSB1 bacterium]|nr:calcium/sodium antiporter [candidate division KSB1 bacterium]